MYVSMKISSSNVEANHVRCMHSYAGKLEQEILFS